MRIGVIGAMKEEIDPVISQLVDTEYSTISEIGRASCRERV